ncbi:hypothetical protein FHX42_000094 [Saccharopolyspora lacisalsi]|uniref:Uncharacterized protein n=1 Tax=Halosaccharopolyspora lacisalsi TaxID=1000566 RepID=A0A839DU17_9PSEU|nr:hypothetical protein [Halosaccharopolyspora lacisalsi]MBA8822765.1 hypothetical protein [Halosaccharopolyspora lacisalsi]
MRSRLARAGKQAPALVAAMMAGGTATAHAATPDQHLDAQATPLDALSAPVAATALGLGLVGMVVGTLRRKKIPVQPENQRKT